MKPHNFSIQPFLTFSTLQRPARWSDLFKRKAPLVVEIGFGNGEFLMRQAKENPGIDYIGIERGWRCLRRALQRIDCSGLTNVRLLQIDARVALDRYFKPQSLTQIFMLFPCPWPTKRQAKHRLLAQPFLQ